MKRSTGARTAVFNLPESLQQQLNMYALAASAAGVGMLALAQPVSAKVVYTHAHVSITVDGGFVELDLNHDGINDFQFYDWFTVENRHRRFPSDAQSTSSFNVAPVQKTNRIYAVKSNSQLCAAALPKGVKVGPHSPFEPGASTLNMAFNSNYGAAFCPWRPVKSAYLGVKFVVKGKVHYGWVRVKRVASRYAGFPAVITGYAYETIPNKPIKTGETKGAAANRADDSDFVNLDDPGQGASLGNPIPDIPKPASLGMLALGAQGVPLWRRSESVGETCE
jgi:hypothetical protein